MLGDLKEKAAGIDRKRIYTAVVALLVAGTAGHLMQRTSGSAPETADSAPPVAALDALTAPQDASPAQLAATTVPPAPEAEELAGTEISTTTAQVQSEPVSAAAADSETALPGSTGGIGPQSKSPVMAGLATATASGDGLVPAADQTLEEVTRSNADPLLALSGSAAEPTPERPDETVLAATGDLQDLDPATAATPAEPEPTTCAIDLQARARPAAMIEIILHAPCNAGEPVSFEHAGLRFTEKLGPAGSLMVEVPAMTGTARVSARVSGGDAREISVTLPDFDAFDRIGVIWQGSTGLQLHAMEGGASYGDPGHKWSDTPGNPDEATAGEGGFISVLGSTASGYAADVYTYPASLMQKGVEPEISVEAEVMQNTCGGEIEGFILRSNPGRAPNAEPLRMKVPGCDAVGEYLVLKNLPVELKLARR